MNANWLEKIDNTWTLFLDRDGVINEEIQNDYVRNLTQFVLYKNVPQILARLSTIFQNIIIVTNQRGVGRGLMSENDLHQIHVHLQNEVEKEGGRIAKILYCIDTDSNSPCRKPNIGMALQAKKIFPNIDFSKSIMVGNNASDIQFGHTAGCKTVFVETTKKAKGIENIDMVCNNLEAFATFINTKK